MQFNLTDVSITDLVSLDEWLKKTSADLPPEAPPREDEIAATELATETHQKRRRIFTSGLLRGPTMGISDEETATYMEGWLSAHPLPQSVIDQQCINTDQLFARYPGAVEFGHDMKSAHFRLAPHLVFLNTGSYGATPKVVTEARREWELLEVRDPVTWRSQVTPFLLQRVRNKLSNFVGCHPADLALMVNCNTATSTIFKSLPWEVGDTLILLSCDYDATKLAAKVIEEQFGVNTVYIEIVLPLSDDEIVQSIDRFLEGMRKRGEPLPRLANFCHITSKTGWIFPAKRMVACFHSHGVPVLVDGAQVPGHIPLDIADIGAEYYIGTCHKWMYSCQGTAFLVAAPDAQKLLSPLSPDCTYDEGFARGFATSFTHDFTPFLALLQSFEFVDRLCGGWQKVMAYNMELAKKAADELARMWNLEGEGLAPIQMHQIRNGNCLPVVPLPGSRGATATEATKMMGYLLAQCGITAFLLIERFRLGRTSESAEFLAVRLTCQIHVSIDDVRKLGTAVKGLKGTYSSLADVEQGSSEETHKTTEDFLLA